MSGHEPDVFLTHCIYFFNLIFIYGALAQLGERLLCTQEVSGSIPLGSIGERSPSNAH